tara:strand:- start:471 stop:851 length:381 start_codon:yes stop_codon:yes gene_type:complete
MKTDLEKFQEIVKDINTTIFGKKTYDNIFSWLGFKDDTKRFKEYTDWERLARTTSAKIEDLEKLMGVDIEKAEPKKKRGRGRPKGSKNKKNNYSRVARTTKTIPSWRKIQNGENILVRDLKPKRGR